MGVHRLGIFEMCYGCDKFKMPEDGKSQEWRKLNGQTIHKADTLFMCGRCHIAQYCSQDCQKSDWKIHKAHCKASQISYEPETLRKTVKQFFSTELDKKFTPAMMHANVLIKSCFVRFNLLSDSAYAGQTDRQFFPLKVNGLYVHQPTKYWTHNRDHSMRELEEPLKMGVGFPDKVQKMHFLKNKTESFIVQVELIKKYNKNSTFATDTVPVANLLYTVCIRGPDPWPSTQKGWITPNEQLEKLRAPIIEPLCDWLPLAVADLVHQYMGEHPILTDWHKALQKQKTLQTIPPLPENFRAIVESACPIFGQQIQDTHWLTLVSAKDGIPDHWELVTQKLIPKTLNTYIHRMVETLAQINQEKGVHYEVPHFDTIAATISLNDFSLKPVNIKEKDHCTWVQTSSSMGNFKLIKYPPTPSNVCSIVPLRDDKQLVFKYHCFGIAAGRRL